MNMCPTAYKFYQKRVETFAENLKYIAKYF